MESSHGHHSRRPLLCLSDRVKLDTLGYLAAKAHLDLMYVPQWCPLHMNEPVLPVCCDGMWKQGAPKKGELWEGVAALGHVPLDMRCSSQVWHFEVSMGQSDLSSPESCPPLHGPAWEAAGTLAGGSSAQGTWQRRAQCQTGKARINQCQSAVTSHIEILCCLHSSQRKSAMTSPPLLPSTHPSCPSCWDAQSMPNFLQIAMLAWFSVILLLFSTGSSRPAWTKGRSWCLWTQGWKGELL